MIGALSGRWGTIYQTAEGKSQIDVRYEQDIVWLTQRQMSEVFDATPENVLMHLKSIYKDKKWMKWQLLSSF